MIHSSFTVGHGIDGKRWAITGCTALCCTMLSATMPYYFYAGYLLCLYSTYSTVELADCHPKATVEEREKDDGM